MTRVAVLIGVDTYDGLPALKASARAAESIDQSLADAGWQTTLLSGRVGQGKMRAAVIEALANSPEEFLFYFAGHATTTADGFKLLSSNHKPYESSCGLTLEELLGQVKAKSRTRAVVFVDYSGKGTEPILELSVPLGSAVVANSHVDGSMRLSDQLIEGLATGGKKFRAADPSGRITVLSLVSYVLEELANSEAQPVLNGTIDTLTVLKTLVPSVFKEFKEVFRQTHDGEVVADLSPDMEWPTGIEGEALQQFRWDDWKTMQDIQAEAKKSGKEFSFRSRPPGWDITKDDHRKLLNEAQLKPMDIMEHIKQLRDQGLLEVSKPTLRGDLFWGCLRHGQVRLTERGRALLWRN